MICSQCSRSLAQLSKTSSFRAIVQQTKPSRWRTYAIASSTGPGVPPDTLSPPTATDTDKVHKIVSSAPAGTTLKGIQYLKNKSEPVALPEEEYPPWLWTCLTSKKPRLTNELHGGADTQDLYSKSKAKRKAAAKKLAAQGGAEMTVDVPLDHQTVDLPHENSKEASDARLQTKKVSRARRRSDIKERNFLGGLR